MRLASETKRILLIAYFSLGVGIPPSSPGGNGGGDDGESFSSGTRGLGVGSG